MMGIYSRMERNEKFFAANRLHYATKRLCCETTRTPKNPFKKCSQKDFTAPTNLGNPPTQTFLGVRRAFLPIKRFFSLKSADVRGAGTRDEPLRTSA